MDHLPRALNLLAQKQSTCPPAFVRGAKGADCVTPRTAWGSQRAWERKSPHFQDRARACGFRPEGCGWHSGRIGMIGINGIPGRSSSPSALSFKIHVRMKICRMKDEKDPE